MKRCATTMLSLTICAACPTASFATDLVAGPATPAGVETATAASWTGLYGGGTFGATHSSVDVQEETAFVTDDIARFGDHSFIGGGFIGVQAQLWRFVFGVEADATWLNQTFDIRQDEFGGTYPEIETERMHSVSGRAGYLLSQETLLYGRGGMAWIDVHSREFGGFAEEEETVEAWQAGIGMETRISPFLIWRTELLYTQASDSYDIGVDDFAQFDLSYLTARFGIGLQLGLGSVDTSGQREDFDWTGFYAGIYGGGAGTETPHGFYESFEEGPYSDITATYGGRVGANVEIDNRWVWGVEAEVTKIGAEHIFLPDDEDTSAGFDWSASVGLRMGWLATPGTLIYAKAGKAWIQAEAYEPYFSTDSDALLEAYQFGGGIETKLTDSVSVRMEALYTDPDDKLGLNEFGIADSEYTEPTIVSGNVGLSVGF